MVTIHIDGRSHEVKEGRNLLQAILDLGADLPYFCWHPALGSVGACRQCAVKQYRSEADQAGTIIMACMTPVAEGLRISIDDPEVQHFRSSVTGWLMTNHPHDCPVCDEGGECHLQDMTVMTGHNSRDYRFNKRTFLNQDLGPLLNHEMNRCIQCYRCVRFYREYAGGTDLNVFGSRNRTYFVRVEDGVLESPFSGNLAEICPTGVFTDKTTKTHPTRSWDLQTAPSLCMLCGLGCNTLPGERYGSLRRVRNRYHGEINRYFLCDRGRFGYEFVNSPRRIRSPLIREPGGSNPGVVAADQAVEKIAALVARGGAVGIGSPRASLEANYALRRLVGANNFFVGIGGGEARRLGIVLDLLRNPPARTPSLREVERADAVLILGEDVTNTAPLLDLAVRQTVLNAPARRARALDVPAWNDAMVRIVINRERGPLVIATPAKTALDEIASDVLRAAPQDIARFGFAIAEAIDPSAGAATVATDGLSTLVETAAAALRGATDPLIIAGTGSASESILRAAASIAWALAGNNPRTALCLVVPECNSVGVGLFGAADLSEAEAASARGGVGTAIILENDLFDRERAAELESILETARHVVVLDHLESPSTARADVVLPAATFAECGGTFVNYESRAQHSFQVFVPDGEIRASWLWLRRIGERVHGTGFPAWRGSVDVARDLADELPVFAPIRDLVPTPNREPRHRVPRQSHRFSGRTAIHANLQTVVPQPPRDDESPLAFSMEGSPCPPPAALITRYWSPGWNSVQALTRFQEEVGGPLRGGDPGALLLIPGQRSARPPFTDAPERFAPRPDEWLLVPLFHIFGSERLSLETPGVAALAPAPYLALGAEDAARLGATQGELLKVALGGRILELPLRVMTGLAPGCAGLPRGLPGLPSIAGGQWVKLASTS